MADQVRATKRCTRGLGAASVNALAEPFNISLPAISRHLKVLERAGLIARGREAQWRPCRLNAEPIREVADWAGGRTGSRGAAAGAST